MPYEKILIAGLFLWVYLGYVHGQAVSAPNKTCSDNACFCCNVQCTSDNAISCDGNCQDGFHGINCTYNCPTKCTKCIDVEKGGNVAKCLHCKDDYYSTTDQYQCQQLCSGGCITCSNPSMCNKCHPQHEILTDFANSKYCIGKGIYAQECRITAPCTCCNGSCTSGFCDGLCKDGYHGGRCWNKCPNNCVRCIDAQQGGGVSKCTLCKNGYYSTSTLFQCQQSCPSQCKTCDSPLKCTSCKDGDYLTTSGQCVVCPEACLTCDSSSYCISCKGGFFLTSNQCANCSEGCLYCRSASSCTSCKTGYYLDDAKCLMCSLLCYSCSSPESCICSNGCRSNNCDELTSTCSYGCKDNFANKTCDSCISGLHGNNCNENCSIGCESICERTTGTCSACKESYFGDYCEEDCPLNCASSCDRKTGNCQACKPGYYGSKCTLNCSTNCESCTMTDGTCITCSNGFYGNACSIKCPVNCLLDKCEKTSGYCEECKIGYEGGDCNNVIKGNGTTNILPGFVIVADVGLITGPAVGGTIGGLVVIGILIAVIVILKRRVTYKYPQYVIQMDSYKLDPSLIDVLEENDEFDPIYFTGTVDDTKKPCGKLPVKELAQFVDSHGVDYFQDEFLKLPRGLIKSCDDAKKDDNIVKNRYTGIYPYDEHRVRLLPPPPGSDFINACYIDGFKKKKEYIASLGPTMKAMEHFQLFWRMVWQEKVDVIVMVTNLMEGQAMKCEQYWPNVATSSTYGDITVTSQSEETYSEFVVKTLLVAKDEEQRDLHHVHYTAWPDKRVPDDITSLIEFRQKVKSIKPALGGPTIVHCSAGIGRTGTYIALDILINQGKAQKALDIFDWVTRMREQRTSMVQTCEQYEYLHYALVHALTYHCEPIKAKKFQHFMNTASDKRMAGLFKQIQQKKEKVTEIEQEARQMNSDLEGMNRDGADIPGNQHRPFLHLDKKYGESNFINAIYVNSYTIKNRFLIAQTPLPETVKDFLTLITQENCSCIVSMDPPGIQDQSIGEYFSTAHGDVFTHPSYVFEVETQELDSNPSYILRRLTVQFNKRSGSRSRTVYHYRCHHWPQGNRVPNITHFLQLVQDVEAIADRDIDHGPVLVHCLNAAARSGLFCAVSNLIQKMRLEGEVSVVNTLRQIKVRRPLAIPNKDQYVFCYQCVLQFVASETGNDDQAVYGNV